MIRARLLRGEAAEQARRIVPGERFAATSSADEIVADARRQAAAILDDARNDAARALAEATAQGRERGLSAVTELLIAARAEALRARRDSTAELRGLAVRIAEKILGRTLALAPESVVDIAVEAMRHAGEPRAMRLRCHPDDLALLESGRPRLLERCASLGSLQLEADETVARGGCVLESELGVVDARLTVQLDAIERALRGEQT